MRKKKTLELIVKPENPEYVTFIYKRNNSIDGAKTLDNKKVKNIIELLNQANEFSIKYDNEKDFNTYKNSTIDNKSLGFELKLKLSHIKDALDDIYRKNQILATEKFLINPVNLMNNIFGKFIERARISLENNKDFKFNLKIQNTEDIKNKLNQIGFDDKLLDNPNSSIKINNNLDEIFKNNNVIKKLYIMDFIFNMTEVKNYFQPNEYYQNYSKGSYLKDIETYNSFKNIQFYQAYEKKLKEFDLILQEQSEEIKDKIKELKIITEDIKKKLNIITEDNIDQNNSFINSFNIHYKIDEKFKDNIEYIKNKIIDQKTNEKNLIEEFFDIFKNLDGDFDTKLDNLYKSYSLSNAYDGIFGNHLIALFESLNKLDENKIDEIANKIKSIETQIEDIINEINNGINPSTKVSELNLSPNLNLIK